MLTNFVLWLSTNPWIWLFATLVGIAGFILAIVFYYKSKRLKEPMYAIHTENLVSDFSSILNKLEISYAGQRISSLSHTKIILWNNGRETITKADIASGDPLAITMTGNGVVIDCQVITANNPANRVTVELTSPKQALVHFDFLDHRQGAVIQVLHTGNVSEGLAFRGTIIGAGNFLLENRYNNDDVSRISVLGRKIDLFGLLLIISILVGLCSWLFAPHHWGYWDVFRLSISLVGGYLFLKVMNPVMPGLPRGLGTINFNVDCTPKVRQKVKVVYSERETTDYEPQTPHLYQRVQAANPA